MTTFLSPPPSDQQSQAVASAQAPHLDEIKVRRRILTVSTLAFTLLFAVWLMFGILGIPISKELKLTNVEFSWLTAIAILNGSIWRLSFGMLTDRLGGRLMMTLLLLATAIPAFLISFAQSYIELLVYAFLVGMAGNSFSIGIAWNSAWFPKRSQGTALGIFGAGNVGASVTKLIGPAMIAAIPVAGITLFGMHIPGGWRSIPLLYAVLLIIAAVATYVLTPTADRTPGRGRSFADRIRPLSSIRVWRFGLYYVVMFGTYVALSVWLPKYYEDVYHVPLASAALLTALFIFPASLLRPVGGHLSDRFGPRRTMYAVFAIIAVSVLLLAIPPFTFTLDAAARPFHFQLNVAAFTLLVFLLGTGMGVGKAAVYKFIPEYFPHDVGAVGGLVGLLGGLGGFFLPPLFAYAEAISHLPQMTFGVLFLISAGSFLWFHIVVLRIVRNAAPQVASQFEILPTV